MISEGYGVAIPKSGIAIGAVFENVAIPVQGGVGAAPGASEPPCLLMACEEPIAPNTVMPAAAKKNEQRILLKRARVNMRFGFAMIE